MSIFSTDEQSSAYIDEPIVRTPKGYELHQEEILSCSNCKKSLVSILIVKKDCPIYHTVNGDVNIIKCIANCPLCNSFSLVKKFERVKLYIKAIEPLKLVDTRLIGDGIEQRCEIELK